MTEVEKYLKGLPHGDLTEAKRDHLRKIGVEKTDEELRSTPDSILLIKAPPYKITQRDIEYAKELQRRIDAVDPALQPKP